MTNTRLIEVVRKMLEQYGSGTEDIIKMSDWDYQTKQEALSIILPRDYSAALVESGDFTGLDGDSSYGGDFHQELIGSD